VAGIRIGVTALLTVTLAAAASAQSKIDPSIGSWKPNVAKSTFTPGPQTMTIEQKTTDGSGRPVLNVELFERQ